MTGRADSTPRVMWLLNHTSARKFEVPMLNMIGYEEVFLPKIYPNDPNFRSASVDWSRDANLTIPEADLAILNAADWYSGADKRAWHVANKWFDAAFFILVDPRIAEKIANHFHGMALWRAYGLSHGNTYSKVLNQFVGFESVRPAFERLGERFVFAEAYPHLHRVEGDFLRSRSVYLPLGLHDGDDPVGSDWIGGDQRVFFVCPDIGANQVYTDIYREFVRDFGDLPYAIGGAQTVKARDPSVLGYLPLAEHQQNMRRMAVMYYHSSEPNHIHFHPFEAVQRGMPLVFMADGMLDTLGGRNLPGRARTRREAKVMLRRLIDGDKAFARSIITSQTVLLDTMKPSNCMPAWKTGMGSISTTWRELQAEPRRQGRRESKIGVLCNRTRLADGMAIADAIEAMSSSLGESVKAVVGVAGSDRGYSFTSEGRRRIRGFAWARMGREQIARALEYQSVGRRLEGAYLAPDDGIEFFADCDVWLVLDDDLDTPVAPLRPRVVVTGQSLRRSNRTGVTFRTADHIVARSEDDVEHLVGLMGVPRRRVSTIGAPDAEDWWSAVAEWL